MAETRKFHLKHSGFRGIDNSADTTKTLTDELHDDHAVMVTWSTEVDADADTMNDYLDFVGEPDGVMGGDYTMASTAAVTVLGAGRVRYRIGGVLYDALLDTTITLEDSGDIADTKFGAWRVLIDGAGTVTTQDTGAQMAFANAEDALLSLSAVAQTASTACIGYVILENAQGGATAFNIGTTNTNAAGMNFTASYERMPRKQCAGLTAALGAATVLDTGAATFTTGTIDVKVSGLKVAQISAISNQAFDDADTVATTKFGGWVVVTDYAQTGIYALAADGVAGSVSAMTYATLALAQADIDTVVDNLPAHFCPIGQIVVEQGTGTFTAATTNLDDAQTTATFTDYTVGTWDRTATTGADSHKINPPAVPASITAPLIATLTAGKADTAD